MVSNDELARGLELLDDLSRIVKNDSDLRKYRDNGTMAFTLPTLADIRGRFYELLSIREGEKMGEWNGHKAT